MGIYEFKKEDAYRFAREQNIRTRVRGNELIFEKCPYCGERSSDKHKFAINLETGLYKCLRATCDAHGNMITLARDFEFTLSEDVERYFKLRNANISFKRFKDSHRPIEVRDGAIGYLQKRGISEQTCRKYEITTKPDDPNILVFPFKDEHGNLQFVKYRNAEFQKGITAGSKEWAESNCMPILFGMAQCLEGGQLVITEGQIDSLSLSEAGIDNAVSVPTGANGFTWVPYCWDFLQRFTKIVVFGDYENGIITLSEQIRVRFPKKTYIVRKEDYKGCKDANEILQQYGKQALIDAVNHAEYQSSKRLKDMSEVQRVDIENVETIRTEIKTIDKILSGGFKIGSVNLITGKAGNGKSTLASQFLVEGLNQGYCCFIYSGELPDFYVKSWINRQIVGKKELRNSEIDKCNAWYKNRLFVYENNVDLEEEGDTEGLLETMEEAIIQKSCKLLLLDNLMTALDDAATNEQLFMAQSNFVGKLAKIAQKYSVIILLVAHPKKNNLGGVNDGVSGSSNIINKVDTIMSYDRITNEKDADYGKENVRNLVISKNRLTGRLGETKLFYSEDSKRINDIDSFIRNYFGSEDDFMEPIGEDETENPFL